MSILSMCLILLLLVPVAAVANEECANATRIQGSDPFVDNGSTFQASEIGQGNPAANCSFIAASTRGAWYLLQGDDRCYTASTEGSLFDTILAVYSTTAGCEGLSCVRQNDDGDSGTTSEVSFTTTTGVDYYILVAGYSNRTGEYTLTVTVRCDIWLLVCCKTASRLP